MPEISRFFGIVIRMYWPDHAPPHFHAKYGAYEVLYSISDGSPIETVCLPNRINLYRLGLLYTLPNWQQTGITCKAIIKPLTLSLLYNENTWQ